MTVPFSIAQVRCRLRLCRHGGSQPPGHRTACLLKAPDFFGLFIPVALFRPGGCGTHPGEIPRPTRARRAPVSVLRCPDAALFSCFSFSKRYTPPHYRNSFGAPVCCFALPGRCARLCVFRIRHRALVSVLRCPGGAALFSARGVRARRALSSPASSGGRRGGVFLRPYACVPFTQMSRSAYGSFSMAAHSVCHSASLWLRRA